MDNMYAIGVDIVSVHRFQQWHTYQNQQLLKLFSPEEIAYARSKHAQSAQRFAVRFAAKEAILKALTQAFPCTQFSLLRVAQNTSINKKTSGEPLITINWENLLPNMTTHPQIKVSLSHDHCHAIAMVIVIF